MLVTITIIITLAVLSVVGVRSIRQNAHAATASASLRQNAVAIQSYVGDKGRYPEAYDGGGVENSGGGAWSWQIREYLNYQSTASWPTITILHPRHGVKGIDKLSGWDRDNIHHFSASTILLQDEELNPPNKKDFVRPVQVNNPSTTVMLGDAPLKVPGISAKGCHAGYWELRDSKVRGNPNSKVDARALKQDVEFWFNGKAHFLFADGHVEVLAPHQVLRKHFQL